MIVELQMSETEIHSILRALAVANMSERTDKQYIQINTWIAERLIKRLEAALLDSDRFKIPNDPASHRSHK